MSTCHRQRGSCAGPGCRDARSLEAYAATLERSLEELQTWVSDLQSGMYVNCVYCGHRYGPGETTPVSMADALKAHVEQCPKHPMSALKQHLDEAHAAIRWLMARFHPYVNVPIEHAPAIRRAGLPERADGGHEIPR